MEQIDWTKLVGSIVQFASFGPPGWVAAGVLTVVFGVGAWLLARYLNKVKNEQANKQTDAGRGDAISGIAKKGRDAERDANSAASDIDNAARGKKNDS